MGTSTGSLLLPSTGIIPGRQHDPVDHLSARALSTTLPPTGVNLAVLPLQRRLAHVLQDRLDAIGARGGSSPGGAMGVDGLALASGIAITLYTAALAVIW